MQADPPPAEGDLVRAAGVLVFRGDPIEEFLLMRHPTRWDLPKGHLDPGEDERACALRELEEETGITADDIEIDPVFRWSIRYTVSSPRHGGQPRPKQVVYFLARLVRDVDIRPTEHEEFRWFRWSPPHAIQEQTIDPLLAAVQAHVENRPL